MRGLFLGVALTMMVNCQYALANLPLIGAWSDNAPRETRIGELTISPHSIKITGRADYSVNVVGSFGAGQLYKATGVKPPHDPMGCGPSGLLTYIAVRPIPVEPVMHRQAIMVIFYAGSQAPQTATIDNDRDVCDLHSFSRRG
jgi:hypothetical protein